MPAKILKIIIPLACFSIFFWYVAGVKAPNRPETVPDPGSGTFRATDAYHAMKWYNDQRVYPTGRIPLHWRENAERQIAAARMAQTALGKTASPTTLAWTYVGPDAIGGRTRSIVINPQNTNVIYCGSVSGGIFKTTDAGASWFPTTDHVANMVIGAMVMDPVDTSIIYAGTGEGYFNVDALRGGGVLKSTDAGASWTLLSNFINPPSTNYYYINKLIIRPDNRSVLYAGTLEGIWKTTDAGLHWNRLSVPASGSTGCTDLVADPTNPDIMHASFGLFRTNGIYKTTNGGSNWTKESTGLPPVSTSFHRISLAISQSNPSVLYAAFADSNNGTLGIWRTTDAGAGWSQVQTPHDGSAQVNSGYLWVQGWYANVIAVDPSNPDVAYAGGVNLFKTTNGGTSWARISDGYANGSSYVHVDQHAIAFVNSSLVYFGNDGGMFKSTNGGSTFIEINTNLATTQFYSVAVHPGAEIYYGGTQDNGTLRTTSAPSWAMVNPGDGGVTAVDFTTPTTVYTEYLYLALLKSTSSGAPNTFGRIMNGIPSTGSNPSDGASDRVEFIAPYTMDPSNSQVLVAGTYRVFRTTNGGGQWSAISNDLTGAGAGQQGDAGPVITALAIAKSSSSTIYAGTGSNRIGLDTTKVWVTTNAGGTGMATWTEITRTNLPDRYVTAITVDPANRDRAFVCYSGYGSGHVFRTTNRGASWTDVSGDLPDLPVNALVIDPAGINHLIIGTDLGIFETTDGGTGWSQQNLGLANVSVADLELRGDQFLFAATHGRGMFKTSNPINAVPTTHLTVALHQNPVLSRYVEIILASDTGLSGTQLPSVQVAVGGGANDTPPVTRLSSQMYKASYEFQSSGNAVISAVAYDQSGIAMATQRTFQVQLAKQGAAGTIATADGLARMQVPAGALGEDTYMTIFPEDSRDESLVSRAFTFGPGRSYSHSLTVSLAYDASKVPAGRERDLTLLRLDGTDWVAVPTVVNVGRATASAQVTVLGQFAVGLRPGSGSGIVPDAFALSQNYPNPFNPTTHFDFRVPISGFVSLKIYDVLGQEVATLVNEAKQAGEYRVEWDASNQPSGVYFCRMQAGTFVETRKLALVR